MTTLAILVAATAFGLRAYAGDDGGACGAEGAAPGGPPTECQGRGTQLPPPNNLDPTTATLTCINNACASACAKVVLPLPGGAGQTCLCFGIGKPQCCRLYLVPAFPFFAAHGECDTIDCCFVLGATCELVAWVPAPGAPTNFEAECLLPDPDGDDGGGDILD